MLENDERALIPIASVAFPMALLDAVEGRLWVRAASPALLAQAGLDGLSGHKAFGFEPTRGPFELKPASARQAEAEAVISVVTIGAARKLRGRLALRRHGELLVGCWMGREHDWRFEQIVQESPDVIAISLINASRARR